MRYNIFVSAKRGKADITGNITKGCIVLDSGDKPDLATVQEMFNELQKAFIHGSVEHIVLHGECSATEITSEVILRSSFYMADDCVLTMSIEEVEE